MAIVLVAAGTYVTSNNGVTTPVAGGAYQAGDALIIHATEAFFTDNLTTPTGWTLLSPDVTCPRNKWYGKIAASSSETIPTLTWSSGTASNDSVLHIFRGVDPSFTSILSSTSERASTDTTGPVGPAGTRNITQDNGLILFGAGQNKTSNTNGQTVSAPSGYTMLGYIAPSNASTRCTACSCYQIQTAGTTLPANLTMAYSINELANQSFQATVIALAAAPSGGGGGGGGPPNPVTLPPTRRKTYVFYDLYYPR